MGTEGLEFMFESQNLIKIALNIAIQLCEYFFMQFRDKTKWLQVTAVFFRRFPKLSYDTKGQSLGHL